jgi:hypothetical protein
MAFLFAFISNIHANFLLWKYCFPVGSFRWTDGEKWVTNGNGVFEES